MTYDKTLNIRYDIPEKDVKRINELLAGTGWTVGSIFRARNIEIVEAQRRLDSARFEAELKARLSGNYVPGHRYFVENEPEYRAAYEAYMNLYYED